MATIGEVYTDVGGGYVPTTPDPRLPTQDQMLIQSADWAQLQDNIDAAVGQILTIMFGSANLQIFSNPSGSYYSNAFAYQPALLHISNNNPANNYYDIGFNTINGLNGLGANSVVICQGRVLDQCGAQNFTAPNPTLSNGRRIDAVYMQPLRHPGPNPTQVTRPIRPTTTLGFLSPQAVQLVNGSATVNFGATYTQTPQVIIQPILGSSVDVNGANVLPSNRTTTGCTITSTDVNDQRLCLVFVVGDVIDFVGVPTNIDLLVSSPNISVQVGHEVAYPASPQLPPPPSDGTTWELYAVIYVTGGSNPPSLSAYYQFPTINAPTLTQGQVITINT